MLNMLVLRTSNFKTKEPPEFLSSSSIRDVIYILQLNSVLRLETRAYLNFRVMEPVSDIVRIHFL